MLILSLTTIFLFIAALAGVVAAAPAPFGARRGEMVLPMQLRHGHLRMRKHGTDQLTCKVLPLSSCVLIPPDVGVPSQTRPSAVSFLVRRG